MKLTQQPLPYAMDALEPVMSRETLEYHWGKHLQAYIDKTNELKEGTRFDDMELEEIVKTSDGKLFNNAAQVWNHRFFFEGFSPDAKKQPGGKFMDQINKDFGSLEDFEAKMADAGANQFGSGWAWLVDNGGKLEVVATPNATNPMTDNKKPLLTLDVWEHAYYIDYRNRRPEYLKKVWALVDWKIVEERYGK